MNWIATIQQNGKSGQVYASIVSRYDLVLQRHNKYFGLEYQHEK